MDEVEFSVGKLWRELAHQHRCDSPYARKIEAWEKHRFPDAHFPNTTAKHLIICFAEAYKYTPDQTASQDLCSLSAMLPTEKSTPGLKQTSPGGDGAPVSKIPAEFRSKGISLQKAATFLGRPSPDSGVRWLKKCINDGTIACESLGRTSHVFDMRQFPQSVHRLMTPATASR